MNLTLNYVKNDNEIKSQNSEGQIGFVLGEDGKPFDLHEIISGKKTDNNDDNTYSNTQLVTDTINYKYQDNIIGSTTLTGNDFNHASSNTPNIAFQPGKHPQGLQPNYHVYDGGQWIIFDGKSHTINVVPVDQQTIPLKTNIINYQYNNETIDTEKFIGDAWGSKGNPTAFQLGVHPKGLIQGFTPQDPKQWIAYDGNVHNIPVNLYGQSIIIKIGNSEGYIKDIPVNVDNENDSDKYAGKFYISLANDYIQDLPPDVYYLEVWTNVYDQNNIPQQLIFPSNSVLPFTISSNIVNGSNAMPMITFDEVQQNWDSFIQLVTQNEANTEKVINSFSNNVSDSVNEVNSNISDYYNWTGSLQNDFQSQSNNVSSAINNLSEQVSGASLNASHYATLTINLGLRSAITNFEDHVSSYASSADLSNNLSYNQTINSFNSSINDQYNDISNKLNKYNVSNISSLNSNINNYSNSLSNLSNSTNILSSKYEDNQYIIANNESNALNKSKSKPNTIVFYPN